MTKIAALLLVGLLQAQAPVATDDKAKQKDEAKRQREQATFLLTGLADEAAKYSDATLRARVQARAANVLWPTDRARAVALFTRAWESATIAYDEAKRKHEEDLRRQREESGGNSVTFGFVDVREEVLRLAATRDRALGEKFFAALAESNKREAETARAPEGPVDPLSQPPDAVAKRLQLAESLLARDDVQTALEFADPALTAVSIPAVEFLTNLRAKDMAAADERYIRLLARATADPASDANTVSVLASYVFSPHSYQVLSEGGRSMQSRRRPENEPEPSAESRAALLQTAAQVLLRPLTAEQLERTSAGRRGTWLLIGRLMPHFVEHAGHLVEQMRARQNALGLDPAALAAEQEELSANPNVGEQPRENRVDRALDRARRAETPVARDSAYMEAGLAAGASDDPRVSEILGWISDDTLRRDMRVWIETERVQRAVTSNNADRALELARKGELTPILRAWAFLSVAKQLAKGDKPRAAEVLGEALEAARDVDLKDPDRARALVAVATVSIDVDPKLVRERLAEAVEAANKSEGFTGEDGTLRMVLRFHDNTWARSSNVAEFDLSKVFGHLAGTDFDEAVLLAKGFSGEAPRAGALLTIAQTVLQRNRER